MDDKFFVSGSKDAKLALWYVQNEYEDEYNTDDGDPIKPAKKIINPTVIKSCMLNHGVRAIKFNKHLNEIVTLSPNGYVHVWDAGCFKQVIENFKYHNQYHNIYFYVLFYTVFYKG